MSVIHLSLSLDSTTWNMLWCWVLFVILKHSPWGSWRGDNIGSRMWKDGVTAQLICYTSCQTFHAKCCGLLFFTTCCIVNCCGYLSFNVKCCGSLPFNVICCCWLFFIVKRCRLLPFNLKCCKLLYAKRSTFNFTLFLKVKAYKGWNRLKFLITIIFVQSEVNLQLIVDFNL